MAMALVSEDAHSDAHIESSDDDHSSSIRRASASSILKTVVTRITAMEASLLQLHTKFDRIMETNGANAKVQSASPQFFDISEQTTSFKQVISEIKGCIAKADAIIETNVLAQVQETSPVLHSVLDAKARVPPLVLPPHPQMQETVFSLEDSFDSLARVPTLLSSDRESYTHIPSAATMPPLLNPSTLIQMNKDANLKRSNITIPEKKSHRKVWKEKKTTTY